MYSWGRYFNIPTLQVKKQSLREIVLPKVTQVGRPIATGLEPRFLTPEWDHCLLSPPHTSHKSACSNIIFESIMLRCFPHASHWKFTSPSPTFLLYFCLTCSRTLTKINVKLTHTRLPKDADHRWRPIHLWVSSTACHPASCTVHAEKYLLTLLKEQNSWTSLTTWACQQRMGKSQLTLSFVFDVSLYPRMTATTANDGTLTGPA